MKPEFELAKKLKGPSQLDRVRAARAIIDAQQNGRQSESLALAGFMAIFHPDFPEDKVRDMCRDLRNR